MFYYIFPITLSYLEIKNSARYFNAMQIGTIKNIVHKPRIDLHTILSYLLMYHLAIFN